MILATASLVELRQTPTSSDNLLLIVSSSSFISRASQTIVTSDMIAKMIGAVYVGGRDENDDALMPSAQELRPKQVKKTVKNIC